ALEAGITGIIEARDRDADHLLVSLPNLEKRGHVAPARAVLWTKVFSRGKGEPARETPLATLLGS
ncbi:hypothetical protein HY251_17645, partial [bacterium]|nr:hypothetical protein [bacterium]